MSDKPIGERLNEVRATDDKYVVFKKEDWINAVNGYGQAEPIEDAVVIRRQDVFAPPALDAYANSISVTAEVLRQNGQPNTAEHLQAVSDYFHEQAVLSWETERKLPD